ncbi:unnamed protein product, partial [Didymodactylos carnosus]
ETLNSFVQKLNDSLKAFVNKMDQKLNEMIEICDTKNEFILQKCQFNVVPSEAGVLKNINLSLTKEPFVLSQNNLPITDRSFKLTDVKIISIFPTKYQDNDIILMNISGKFHIFMKCLDALDDASKLEWNGKVLKFIFHILYSPDHGKKYTAGSSHWPEICPCNKSDAAILTEINNKKINYHMIMLTTLISIMVKEFERYITVKK